MSIILPHSFKDGVDEVASGVQVMDNLNVLRTAIEALQTRSPLTGMAISARTAFNINEDHVADASKSTLVIATIVSPKQAPVIEAKVLVGGTEVEQSAVAGEEGQRWFSATFPVAPGVAWRVNAGGAWGVTAAYCKFST